MRRKLIKQGNSGLTLYIPKEWAKQNKLSPGDEIELIESEFSLNVICETQEREIEVSLIDNSRESVNRVLITNAYRAGFDLIKLNNSLDKKNEIQKILDKFLEGFEIINDEDCFKLISLSEAKFSKLDTQIEKQLFILEEIIKKFLSNEKVEDLVFKFQKNDNLIRRLISKNYFQIKGVQFLWQFLTSLTHISRFFYHASKDLPNTNILEKYLEFLYENFQLIKKSFLRKDKNFIYDMHELDEIIKEIFESTNLSENNLYYLNLYSVGKEMYLSSSSLIGYIQMNSS